MCASQGRNNMQNCHLLRKNMQIIRTSIPKSVCRFRRHVACEKAPLAIYYISHITIDPEIIAKEKTNNSDFCRHVNTSPYPKFSDLPISTDKRKSILPQPNNIDIGSS